MLGSENSSINTNLPIHLFGSLRAFTSNGQKSFYKNKKRGVKQVGFRYGKEVSKAHLIHI
jgi:hypothetical protein